MNKIHTLKIINRDNRTTLVLDGVDLSERCTHFCLIQDGGETPVLHIELCCDEVEVSADGVSVKKQPPPQKQERPEVTE